MSGNPFDDLAEESDESGDSDDVAADVEPGTDVESEPTTDVESTETTRMESESATEVEPELETDSGSVATSTEAAAASVAAETSQETSVEGPSLGNSSPPFPYSEAEQKQMYVQDGLWDEFEDLGFDAELELRRSFDVRNVEQRELDTAVIRLVLDQFSAKEIAEMVIQMRGFDPTDLD